jgi:hypothetical protein
MTSQNTYRERACLHPGSFGNGRVSRLWQSRYIDPEVLKRRRHVEVRWLEGAALGCDARHKGREWNKEAHKHFAGPERDFAEQGPIAPFRRSALSWEVLCRRRSFVSSASLPQWHQ